MREGHRAADHAVVAWLAHLRAQRGHRAAQLGVEIIGAGHRDVALAVQADFDRAGAQLREFLDVDHVPYPIVHGGGMARQQRVARGFRQLFQRGNQRTQCGRHSAARGGLRGQRGVRSQHFAAGGPCDLARQRRYRQRTAAPGGDQALLEKRLPGADRIGGDEHHCRQPGTAQCRQRMIDIVRPAVVEGDQQRPRRQAALTALRRHDIGQRYHAVVPREKRQRLHEQAVFEGVVGIAQRPARVVAAEGAVEHDDR